MKEYNFCLAAFAMIFVMVGETNAAITSMSGPTSSWGTAPAIIAAPSDVLNAFVTNTGMQGFDEAQGVITTAVYGIDGGGSIAAGTLVDSHMIFLNSPGGRLGHYNVVWTFSGPIVGVMSNISGTLEAGSTPELGNPLTKYPAAGFSHRGLNNNSGTGGPYPNDGYTRVGNTITVGLSVSSVGDWIRVVTSSSVIPAPGAILLSSIGVGFVGWLRRRRTL